MTRHIFLAITVIFYLESTCQSVWSAEIDPFVMDNLVVISAGNASASGFMVSINSTNYLVTNEHVLRVGLPFRAELHDGTIIKHDKTIHLSKDSDIALIKTLDQSRPALMLSQGVFNIGDPINVIGNSGGHGVLTRLSGTIVGVGPRKIEIDANIQEGNSGSPVLLSDGTVAGIATYVARPAITRAAPDAQNEVRRFALRLDNLTLVPTEATLYFKVAAGLSDLETFVAELKTIISTTIKNNGYSLELNRKKYKAAPRLSELLYAYSIALDNVYQIEHALADIAAKYGNDINRVPQSVMDNLFSSLHFRSIDHYRNDLKRAHRNLLREPTNWIESNKWLTDDLNSEALQYRDYIESVLAILPGKDGHARIK